MTEIQWPPCPECRGWLDVHQPDERRDLAFIVVCLNCGKWWLMEYTVSRWDVTGEAPRFTRITLHETATTPLRG